MIACFVILKLKIVTNLRHLNVFLAKLLSIRGFSDKYFFYFFTKVCGTSGSYWSLSYMPIIIWGKRERERERQKKKTQLLTTNVERERERERETKKKKDPTPYDQCG